MIKIAMYDLEGHLLEVFETNTLAELERDLKISVNSLSGCINNKSLQTNQRQFRKVYDSCDPVTKIGSIVGLTNGVNFQPIAKYYKGKFVKSYTTLKEASEINLVDSRNISSCCAGRKKSAGGFEWKYMD